MGPEDVPRGPCGPQNDEKRMRRCFGGLGVINPSGRPSCREEGDKWEKRSLPHHREDHDRHDRHHDIEDDDNWKKRSLPHHRHGCDDDHHDNDALLLRRGFSMMIMRNILIMWQMGKEVLMLRRMEMITQKPANNAQILK